MGKAMGFEELIVWQKSRVLIKEIYLISSKIRDYGYKVQIQRAAVSVMNNIAEGYEAGSSLMFKKFLYIALGSCGEVRSMLYIGVDLDYIDPVIAKRLIREYKALSAEIKSFIKKIE